MKSEEESTVSAGAPTPLRGRGRSVQVRVPASTSNLGSGFDCFGLALQLYLAARATVVPELAVPFRIRSRGDGSSAPLPRTAENLIFRAMRFAAEREGLRLPPVRIAVRNEIPLGRGLGSSAAAIVAGVTLCGALCGREIEDGKVLRYATEFEGHPDNVAASLHGGWVITCTKRDGGVIAVKKRWPSDLRIIIVSPHAPMETTQARAALPDVVRRADAVHNLQRAALFGAALEEHTYDLLWEAMQDRLHQSYRRMLCPGLAEALATPPLPGLVGLALSGAGPSVLALATDHFNEISDAIKAPFRRNGIETTVYVPQVDNEGRCLQERTTRPSNVASR